MAGRGVSGRTWWVTPAADPPYARWVVQPCIPLCYWLQFANSVSTSCQVSIWSFQESSACGAHVMM
jgi:hypothetical protein